MRSVFYFGMSYKAIIAGASGLIGSKLLNILLQQPQYDEVLILVRKALPIKHKKLVQLVVEFDKLDEFAGSINGHALFCCLGSTRKKTPDLAEYRKIDHDYPVKLAQLAKRNGVVQYHLVSALGANSKSSNFYNKMKGETEDAMQQAGLKCLHIYEPSLLTGDRTEYRLAERIFTILMKILDPLLNRSLKKYRSIPAETVAMAMFKQSLKNEEGVFIHPSDKIKLLA
ncbi:MAG: NAD-dependent epimerase/dehydratase family protein [Mucilaginibacter sp.]|nr:NAD-dependent epimerase/dehydratase family protein [Mucilaginibacter sp.]